MNTMQEHITHSSDSLKGHLNRQQRIQAAEVLDIRAGSLEKCVIDGVDARPLTVPRMLALLGADKLNDEYLTSLLAPYGYCAIKIDGFSESPACSLTATQVFAGDMAQMGENGDFEQCEKRRALKLIPKLISKLGGLYHHTRETIHTCSPFYRKHRAAAE